MIDENSHYLLRCKQRANNMSSLRKRAPIEVFLTSTGIASSFSSQEPRRPRFSFFYLHNVKELTSLPSRARTSSEADASIFLSRNRTSYPVARQIVCPFRKC
jgi:hypothetical protein